MGYELLFLCTVNKGKKRAKNQDNIVYDKTYLDYLDNTDEYDKNTTVSLQSPYIVGVFDGLGGEQFGEVASYIAAKDASCLTWNDDIKKVLMRYITTANNHICEYAQTHKITSMGTTAAIIVFHKRRMTLCNIGDSKIFCFNGKELLQLSADHTSAAVYGMKAPLTQCLGIPDTVLQLEPHYVERKAKKNELYLLCSDGLTDAVDHTELINILKSECFENISKQLVQKALDNGGTDNISVIVCKVTRRNLFNLPFGGIKLCR